MADRCIVREPTDFGEWHALFARVEQPHMVQSWAYGEAKEAAGGWRARRFVFEHEGEPVAMCQLLDKQLAGIRLAARLNRGPLFLEPTQGRTWCVMCTTLSDIARGLHAEYSFSHLRWHLIPRTTE